MFVAGVALAIFNVVYTVLFYFMENWPMMIYSAVSVALFSGAVIGLCKAKKHLQAAILISIIVLLQTFLATVTSGFRTGFSIYNFGLVTGSFYFTYALKKDKRNDLIPLIFSVFCIICYFINYGISLMIDPMYPVSKEIFVNILYVLNLLLGFIIIIIFNFLFLWEISLKETTLEDQNEALSDMAHKDPLTKLLNRRNMNEILDKSAEDMKLTGKRFSLILGDIDDFKHVNDTYGHDAGDAVLVNVAEIIRSSVRANDAVCRWGGEEFLILINASGETASNTAERIRKSIQASTVQYKDQAIKVTMTFGLAEAIPGYKVDALIHQADDKLYIGKNSGKNTVII